jgi:hypothetical protein
MRTHFFKQYNANIFLLIILAYLAISCNSQKNNSKIGNPPKRKIETKDNSLKEYRESFIKIIRTELQTQLSVAPIENGFMGLQIRIYKFSPSGNNQQMIVLQDSNSHWSAKLVDFSIHLSEMHDSVGVAIEKVTKREPHSSWQKLMDSLIGLDIFTLPDSDSLQNYSVPADGEGIEIEYARGNDYRSYSYSSPDLYYDSIPEAKKMVQITNLIESEFDFKNFGFAFNLDGTFLVLINDLLNQELKKECNDNDIFAL